MCLDPVPCVQAPIITPTDGALQSADHPCLTLESGKRTEASSRAHQPGLGPLTRQAFSLLSQAYMEQCKEREREAGGGMMGVEEGWHGGCGGRWTQGRCNYGNCCVYERRGHFIKRLVVYTVYVSIKTCLSGQHWWWCSLLLTALCMSCFRKIYSCVETFWAFCVAYKWHRFFNVLAASKVCLIPFSCEDKSSDQEEEAPVGLTLFAVLW